MSESVFALPDLGEGLDRAEVIAWLVAEGDHVDVDQEIVTVETAKASVDVPCPYAGRVSTLHARPGDSVGVGAALVTIDSAADNTSTPPGNYQGSGAVLIGYGTSEDSVRAGQPHRRPHRRSSVESEHGPDHVLNPIGAVKVISPLVRREARERGLDLTALEPANDDGIIRRADLDRLGAANPAGTGSQRRIPLVGIRGAVADKVSTSRAEIPDATAWVDVDATEFMGVKETLARLRPDDGIAVLPLLARVATAGLRQFPELNARVNTAAHEIVQDEDIHLGVAMQTPRGLMVPVLHNAQRMNAAALAASVRTLSGRAREGRLTPGDLTGGTFTLNNFGVFGVDGSTPIINHPEAGMLGVGRIIERPWVHEGKLAVRMVAQISLTFDHRVCDGGSAGGFLRFVADRIEHPALLLASL